jgi:hypothetical protein
MEVLSIFLSIQVVNLLLRKIKMIPIQLDLDNPLEIILKLRQKDDYEPVFVVTDKITGLPFDFTDYRFILQLWESKDDTDAKVTIDSEDGTVVLATGSMTWKLPKTVTDLKAQDHILLAKLIKVSTSKERTVLTGKAEVMESLYKLPTA